jgi:hypothetical protein
MMLMCLGLRPNALDGLKLCVRHGAAFAAEPFFASVPSQGLSRLHQPGIHVRGVGQITLATRRPNHPHDAAQVGFESGMDDDR